MSNIGSPSADAIRRWPFVSFNLHPRDREAVNSAACALGLSRAELLRLMVLDVGLIYAKRLASRGERPETAGTR